MKLTSQNAQRAVHLSPDLAAGYISAGLVEMEAKHTELAAAQFQAAASLDPKSAAPYRWRGILYDSNEKSDQAREALSRALKLNPGDWRTYMELAYNSFQKANYREATANWEHALKLEPDNLDALESLGGVYHLLGRDEDGATALQRALEIKPDADTYNNLGTIRFGGRGQGGAEHGRSQDRTRTGGTARRSAVPPTDIECGCGEAVDGFVVPSVSEESLSWPEPRRERDASLRSA